MHSFLAHSLFESWRERHKLSARQPDRRGVHFWGCLFWALPPFSPEAPDGGDSAQAPVAATTADDGRGLEQRFFLQVGALGRDRAGLDLPPSG